MSKLVNNSTEALPAEARQKRSDEITKGMISSINDNIEKNEEFDKKCEEEHKELSHLAYKAREHWKEFQPTLYKRLKAEGTLEQRLEEAAQRTLNEMDQLMNAGFLDYEAREIVYPRYILLRDENEDEDIPEGENPGLDAIHAGHVAMRKIQDEM